MATVAERWSYATASTPIGPLLVACTPRGVVRVAGASSAADLAKQAQRSGRVVDLVEDARAVAPALRCLEQWFAGQSRSFDLRVDLIGTEFECSVWRQLQQIPFGSTRTYGQLAQALGRPGAARAVGTATGRNPLLLVVPCHRLLGSAGLGGFSAPGGVRTKQALLEFESGLYKFR